MTTSIRLILLGLLALATACAETVTAPVEDISARAYRDPDESYIALMTMITEESGRGAHSGLIVSGSQVALYDPAGTFKHPSLPERDDVLYGLTPQMKWVYESYHARAGHYVLEQKLPVSREFADRVIARMEAQGPSAKMFCAKNTSAILRAFPEFQSVPSSFRPTLVQNGFGEVPGVIERRIVQQDDGQNIIPIPDVVPDDV